MTNGEPHEFGEDTRHLADGLRQLAQEVQAPLDVLPSILARSEQFLPEQQGFRARPKPGLRRWLTHPALWGPALAAASFVAGVLVAPSQLDPPVQTRSTAKHEAGFEQPAASPPASFRRQARALPDAAPTSRSEPEAASAPFRQQRGDVPSTSSPYSAPSEERERLQTSPSPSHNVQVTLSLSPALYERLLEHAEGDAERLDIMLREAVETYMRTRETRH